MMAHNVILNACQEKLPVLLIPNTDAPSTWRGWFADYREGLVTIHLHVPEGHDLLRPLTQCIISFHRANHSYCFIAAIRRFEGHPRPGRLVFRVPEQLASERRSSVRIPIDRDSALRVRITDSFEEWSVRGVDVSLTGMLVEFSGVEEAEFSLDSKLQVTIELQGLSSDLEGIVRRSQGSQLGLFFPSAVREDGRLKPPETFVRIVRKLEKAWLQQLQSRNQTPSV